MKIALLLALSLAIQLAFGLPAAPGWLATILLPTVFIIAPPLMFAEKRWPYFAIGLGLAWDLVVLGPVIGPGAIAWSAAAVVVSTLAPLVADRSTRAWIAFGALGALVMILVRHVALLPLGLATTLEWEYVLTSTLLTSLWCGLVGWVFALDLPSRWRSYRARKLRS
jgi:hypothetical protein